MLDARRRLIVVWICAYVSWYFAGQWFLPHLRGRETAGWSDLWFLPTMVAGLVAGAIALVTLNRWTVATFGAMTVCHVLVGLGFFPK